MNRSKFNEKKNMHIFCTYFVAIAVNVIDTACIERGRSANNAMHFVAFS
jgi:hypothetical protein